MYRHGDVLLTRVDRLPENAMARPGSVLARGEATGHSHRVAESRAAELFDVDGVGYLHVLTESATLVHDEHAPISLPRGFYKFWMQREYSPKEIRRIVD
jgi:hypothetical protein